ncbi:MAG: hypothetical protein IJZ46_03355, partial [Bacilli bacterium]|nr:hypothetical protein [Bacilli bacterium]
MSIEDKIDFTLAHDLAWKQSLIREQSLISALNEEKPKISYGGAYSGDILKTPIKHDILSDKVVDIDSTYESTPRPDLFNSELMNTEIEKFHEIIGDNIYKIEDLKKIKNFMINRKLKKLLNTYSEDMPLPYIICIAKYVKNVPIDKLTDIIIKTQNTINIGLFGKYVQRAPIDIITEAFLKIANINEIIWYANNVKGAPIDKLADTIINTGNAIYICDFAECVKGAPIDKLADGIIKTDNAAHICIFAECVKGAPIDKLADGIIKTGNATCIYYFANNVKGAPIDKLADGIINTGNARYIYRFANNVKGAPIDKL